MHRVEASALPESFHGKQQLVSGAFITGGVPEGDRPFAVLDNGDIGIGPDLQCAYVVRETDGRGRFGRSQRQCIVDRVTQVDVLRERRHQVEHRPPYVVAVDIGRNRAGAKSLFEAGLGHRE